MSENCESQKSFREPATLVVKLWYLASIPMYDVQCHCLLCSTLAFSHFLFRIDNARQLSKADHRYLRRTTRICCENRVSDNLTEVIFVHLLRCFRFISRVPSISYLLVHEMGKARGSEAKRPSDCYLVRRYEEINTDFDVVWRSSPTCSGSKKWTLPLVGYSEKYGRGSASPFTPCTHASVSKWKKSY